MTFWLIELRVTLLPFGLPDARWQGVCTFPLCYNAKIRLLQGVVKVFFKSNHTMAGIVGQLFLRRLVGVENEGMSAVDGGDEVVVVVEEKGKIVHIAGECVGGGVQRR